MKGVLICAGILLLSIAGPGNAQRKKASPAAEASATINGKVITIKYSSPRLNGRTGQLFEPGGRITKDPTYPVWRAGADEATLLHTDADLDINGLSVPKGDYTLFADVKDPNNWMLIVNKQTGQWGLTYDAKQDLGRVKMTMSKPPAPIENLKYTLTSEGGNRGKLTLEWENRIASVPFTVK